MDDNLRCYVGARVTVEQKKVVELAAVRAGDDLVSDFVRRAVFRETRRVLGPDVLPDREVEGADEAREATR